MTLINLNQMNDLIYISIFSLPWSEARPALRADNAALIQKRRKMEQERINGQWGEIGEERKDFMRFVQLRMVL